MNTTTMTRFLKLIAHTKLVLTPTDKLASTIILSLPLLFLSSVVHAQQLRIMPVGDSITSGVYGAVSYRKEFISQLGQTSCLGTMVGSKTTSGHVNPNIPIFTSPHEGYSGNTADHFINGNGPNPGIDIMMSQQNPDVVLLHIGSNDMRLAQNIAGTVNEINDVISRILSANNNAYIFVANVIPWFGTSGSNPNIQSDIQALSAGIDTMVTSLGNSNVVLVNVNNGYLSSMMLPDLIHPDTAGETFIAARFVSAIQQTSLCYTPPTTCNGKTITVDIAAGQIPTTGSDVILGTNGNDIINGSDGNDTICGEGGDDVILGGDGYDWISGGYGNDTIYGDALSDRIYGDEGNDTIFGGDKSDILNGGPGVDTIHGEAGNDLVYGGPGADEIHGGIGNDRLFGQGSADEIFGDDGDDKIYGGQNDDDLYGGNGIDRIWGQTGHDYILGGAGNDSWLDGGDHDDRVSGQSGNDIVRGGNGSDEIFGGPGNDDIRGQGGDDLITDGGSGTDSCQVAPGNDVAAVNCE